MRYPSKVIPSVFAPILEEADIRVDGDRPWDIRVHDERFFTAVAARGSLGLGEAYMDGWWDVDALDAFFCRLLKSRRRAGVSSLGELSARLASNVFNLQTRARSLAVAEIHYDIGNAFYEAMLDPYMQYTCAWWKAAQTLEEAQWAKLDMICQKLELQPGDTVLELGCGWGGFARFAAERYGCQVTACNISKEQVAFARQSTAGLPVEVIHGDYRDVTGRFDKIVSIGMTEHVGHKNYRQFYELQRGWLKNDGLILQHTIGSDITKTTTDPWIDRYIFPGGLVPSLPQLSEAWEQKLVLEDLHNLGADYDLTLMAWHRNFQAAWPRFEAQYGERFYRMWSYYLLSCAGAFRARTIQLWQFVFSKDGLPGGYRRPARAT